jgi:hypothetical protein
VYFEPVIKTEDAMSENPLKEKAMNETVNTTHDYSAGLAKGVAMTDDECLRFYNGIVCAIVNPDSGLNVTRSAATARQRMFHAMDVLATHGMIAFVGEFGTPVIRQRS